MAKNLQKSGVRSALLTLDVLEEVAFSGEELGVTDIATRVGATKGSVYRHLSTLVNRGYLTQNLATTRYGIGAKSRLLAGFAPAIDLGRISEEAMRELRDKLGHTVVLSLMMPRGALVVSTITSKSSIEIGVRPGSELSFHASAQGKVMLAYAPEAVRQRIINGPLQAFTAKTLCNPATLESELKQIVKRGYASAPEQVLLGINSIAAPVFDDTNACVAAIALVGSIQFLHSKYEKTAFVALRNCAAKVSQKIGHGRSSHAFNTTRQTSSRKI